VSPKELACRARRQDRRCLRDPRWPDVCERLECRAACAGVSRLNCGAPQKPGPWAQLNIGGETDVIEFGRTSRAALVTFKTAPDRW